MPLECPFCAHTWNPKVVNPKSCPRCKRYPTKEKPFKYIDAAIYQERIRTPPEVFPSGTARGGSEHSYYLCYECPTETKKRAVLKIGKHHYCQEHALNIISEGRLNEVE